MSTSPKSCSSLTTTSTILPTTLDVAVSLLAFVVILLIISHYEKSCPWKLKWHATRSSRKLLCNKGTNTIWKYNELTIKMPH